MLKKLYISNYALIDTLEMSLGPGLTIITGETGAGKSILLGALSMLLGARSDSRKARSADRKMVVEGVFDASGYGLREMFEEQGLDWDDDLLLRREVSPSGRSRAFINDTPVTTSLLSQVASRLVDIHSQHQNLLIGSRDFQLRVLDSLADNVRELHDYSSCFRQYVELRRHITALKERATRSRENAEFIRFRLDQLHKLKPKAGEQKELERRLEILSDSVSISESLAAATAHFTAGESSVLSRLHDVKSLLQGVNLSLFERDDDGQPSLPVRLESALIELTDISETLADYLERVDSNPELLRKVDERLGALYDAQRRFNVSDEQGLLDLLDTLESEYASIEDADSELPELERALKVKGKELRRLADALSATRRAAADAFAARLNELARPLGMHNLKFSAMTTVGKLTADGQDIPSFQCAFNKNQPLMPVEKIASGGEISRLMLCLKAIVASRMNLPTIIFDEVDTGVSGDIAARMALLMKEISSRIQVLAITHLPQVAAVGDAHLKVYKEDTDEATHTHIRPLDDEERVRETARMLGGTTVDEAALLNARSLLSHHN